VLMLSVRQPWAWAIIHAGKDIENRQWRTKMRGRFAVHASKSMTREEYESAYAFIGQCVAPEFIREIPHPSKLDLGGIIGTVELVDCVDDSDSPWFVGDYGFMLRDPRPVPFMPCTGGLGFRPVPPELVGRLL